MKKVKKEELIKNVAVNLSAIKSHDVYFLMLASMFFRYGNKTSRKKLNKQIKELLKNFEQEIKNVKHI